MVMLRQYKYLKAIIMSHDEAILISEYEARKRFEDWIDDGELIDVTGILFEPSRIMRELEPLSYQIGFLQFIDGLKKSNILVEGHTYDESDEYDVPIKKHKSGFIVYDFTEKENGEK